MYIINSIYFNLMDKMIYVLYFNTFLILKYVLNFKKLLKPLELIKRVWPKRFIELPLGQKSCCHLVYFGLASVLLFFLGMGGK